MTILELCEKPAFRVMAVIAWAAGFSYVLSATGGTPWKWLISVASGVGVILSITFERYAGRGQMDATPKSTISGHQE